MVVTAVVLFLLGVTVRHTHSKGEMVVQWDIENQSATLANHGAHPGKKSFDGSMAPLGRYTFACFVACE